MNITISFIHKFLLLLLLVVCISFQFAIADPKGNNCDKRSPFETIDEFYGRCPPTAQSVPPPNKLLQNFAPKNDETEVQIRLRQRPVLEIYNAAVLRQDSRYQAGIATLNKADYDGVGFSVKVRWYGWFEEHFNKPSTVYRLKIERKKAVRLWQEGEQKPVFVILNPINSHSLSLQFLLIGLKQTFSLQAMPEPQEPAVDPPSDNRQQQIERRISVQEYTCPYEAEVESVVSQMDRCVVFGLGGDMMAVARIQAHAEALISRMSSINTCRGQIRQLKVVVDTCQDGLDRWDRDMDDLNDVIRSFNY